MKIRCKKHGLSDLVFYSSRGIIKQNCLKCKTEIEFNRKLKNIRKNYKAKPSFRWSSRFGNLGLKSPANKLK